MSNNVNRFTRRLIPGKKTIHKNATRFSKMNLSFPRKSMMSTVGGAQTGSDAPFDHPTHISEWWNKSDGHGTNKAKFFYGLGVILKYKEDEIKKNIKSVLLELQKITEEYKSNENNYKTLLEDKKVDDLTEMRMNMQEKVREQLNISYESRYSELIQKKQSYDTVLKSIENRRWFIVASLQDEDDVTGKGMFMINQINQAARDIYKFYRGLKYKTIREDVYRHLKTIAETPAIYQNSFILNASITGPAGSGKTTLAREIAKWFAKIGILTYDSFFEDSKSKLSFVEVGRSGLIAEYTGQTAPKTLGVLIRSMERTLFIDEAYSVAGCSFDSSDKLESDQYGEEFVAELLRFMNDHKGFNSLIVAGYENLMKKCFFARNEGLPRRFPQQINLPFYSSDELFGIFSRRVVEKSSAEAILNLESITNVSKKGSVKDANKKLELVKYRYLSVMKPSIMMIHFDTTYDGINTLRKYLTVMSMRTELGELSKIDSWTILSHVFINLLADTAGDEKGTNLRRNLFKRIFFDVVFNFSEPNLSYFPAQAGEMENLADECSKSIAPLLSATNPLVQIKDELDIINKYCLGKKIEIHLGKVESMSDKPSEKEKQSKIRQEEAKLREIEDEIEKRQLKAGKVGLVEKLSTGGNTSFGLLKNEERSIIARIDALKKETVVTGTLTSGGAVRGYELCLIGTTPLDMRKRIHDFLKLDLLFPGKKVPTLTALWTMLNNLDQKETIMKHMIQLYTEKVNPEYIEDLLNESEKTYPIHLDRQKLELELVPFKNKIDESEVSYEPNQQRRQPPVFSRLGPTTQLFNNQTRPLDQGFRGTPNKVQPVEEAAAEESEGNNNWGDEEFDEQPAQIRTTQTAASSPQVPSTPTGASSSLSTPAILECPSDKIDINWAISGAEKRQQLQEWNNFKCVLQRDLLLKAQDWNFDTSNGYAHKDYESKYLVAVSEGRNEAATIIKEDILYEDLGITY